MCPADDKTAVESATFIAGSVGELFVIEHLPATPHPETWIIALNSGLLDRSGPRRLYIRLARQLAELGFGVLRVDLPGVGDSAGPPPGTHFDCHDPAHVAGIVDHVILTRKPKNVLLLGLCAGARVAVKAAGLDPRIGGVIAWSAPIYTASPGSTRSPEEPNQRISKSVAHKNIAKLRAIFSERKIFKAGFWKKLLSKDYLLTHAGALLRSTLFLMQPSGLKKHQGRFIKSLQTYSGSQRPILVVYGENDRLLYEEFRELKPDIDEEDIVVVAGGTHTFSTYASHLDVVEITSDWLQRNF